MDLKCSACKTLVFDEQKQKTKGYRCIQCEDFVVCSDCERLTYERHFATHVFIVFNKEHAEKKVKDFPLADKEKVTVNMGSKHPHNCTVCGLPTIVGVMYSCTHCADFHVCSEDYETNPKVANHNLDHSFMKIPTIFAPLNEVIWDLDANSTWFKGKEEKDFLFDTNAMLKQLNDKKKTPAKTSTNGDSKTPKPMIDKQSNARYLDGLTPTPTPTVNSQYTEEGAKNTGAVVSHYTEAFTPVSSPPAPHSQYTNDLGTTSQYVDESARTGASEMLKGNIVSSGYTDGAAANKPVSGYTDGPSDNKSVTTSGYTESLTEDKPIAVSGYTDGSSPAPNADRLDRYIHSGNDSVPPLVYSSSDLSMSNGSLYTGTLEYPVAPSKEQKKEEEPKHDEKAEVKAEVSSPKERKHKEHKHKKEDSKSGMKKSKSERTDEKHKKEKKSKKRSRSNSHGHKGDHALALSAPVTPVKEEPVSVEKEPETCPKRKEKESKVTRKRRSTSMPEKKFKLVLRKSHKSKTNIDDNKTTQSAEVIVHPVLVEPTVPRSIEISPKSPRKDKSSKKSPKSDRPVSMPVQPKKVEDLNSIADFYIETGLQAEGAKDKKHKEKKEKREKKSKRPKSSRSNTATSIEISHANTAPELGRYTSAEELFEINRRLIEGEPSTPKGGPAPSNINLSSSGSAQHNYVSHVDTISNAQEPSKDQKANAPGTSYAANYLTSPPSAAVNYIANPNIDHGVDVESDSEEHSPETELGYQTAINRKMYAATSYSNYGASDDILDLNENAYAGPQMEEEDIETALKSKSISKVQGPISLSKMALRPQATELAQSSGTGTNWGEDYMKTLIAMVGTKDRMMKVMSGEKVEVTPEMRTQVLNFRQHVQDFRAAASNIAKRIIDEAFLPLHQKTIKPVDVGGIAGGQKYVYDGIFLKFAIDLFGVYGGDYAAAKAANRELQGLKGYYESMVPGLMVPPMLLIDYRGFRMVATPCLPISKDTLEYGSADGGLTVLKKSRDLNRKMKVAATKMKLKGHIVGTTSPTQIYGPADIEGHSSSIDGVHFVIDTARVSPPFPPEKTISAIFLPQDPVTTNPWVRYGEGTKLLDVPIKNLKNNLRQYFPHLPAHAQLEESNMPGATIYHVPEQYLKERVLNRIATSAVHKLIYGDVVLIYTLRLRGTQLYDLLRLELLQHPDVPALSSDAFTFFQQAGIEKDNDEADVRKAVKILKEKVIPEFCEDLLNKRINVWSSPTALVDEMHKRGINIKFLGEIRTRIISDPKLDSIVTIEMVARASKYFLRSQLRRIKSREIKQDEIKVILGNFNMVIGDSIASRYYWQFIIRALVTAKFGPSFCDVEKNDLDFDLRSAINDKYALFTALEAHTGIKFKPEIHAKLLANPAMFDKKNVVCASDFDSLEARHRTWGDECIQKKLDRITAALNEAIEKTKESNLVLEEEGQKLHVEVPVV